MEDEVEALFFILFISLGRTKFLESHCILNMKIFAMKFYKDVFFVFVIPKTYHLFNSKFLCESMFEELKEG